MPAQGFGTLAKLEMEKAIKTAKVEILIMYKYLRLENRRLKEKTIMRSFLFAAFLFAMPAFAQSNQNIDKVCSNSNEAVCAEIKFVTEISSSVPGEFMVQISAPEGAAVTDFKAALWMSMGSHGHGSAPLKITPLEANQFNVKNAHFVMMGTWLVKLDFKIGSDSYHLEIPVDVQQ